MSTGTFQELILNHISTSVVESQYTEEDHNLEKAVPVMRRRSISTKRFLKRLQRLNTASDPDILPPSCRYVNQTKNGTTYVVEEPPSIRTIHSEVHLEGIVEKLSKCGKMDEFGLPLDWLTQNPPPHYFQLSFPYVVHIILLNKQNQRHVIRTFLRMTPITSKSDFLFVVPLPNFDQSHTICLGSSTQPPELSRPTAAETIHYTLETFWGNKFNNDYTYNLKKYYNTAYVCDFLTWAYYTHVDPMFIYDVKWKPHTQTLGVEITELEESIFGKQDEDINNRYQQFVSLVYARDTEITTAQKRKNPNARHRICESALFGENYLSIGDDIKIGSDEFYITSFISNGSFSPSMMELEDTDGVLYEVELDDQMKDQINKVLESNYLLDLTLSSGEVIKPGDLVRLEKPFPGYRRVRRIMKSRDGKLEVQLGGELFFADTVEARKIEVDEFELDGVKLVQKAVYTVSVNNQHGFPWKEILNVTYNDIKIMESGHINGLFTRWDGNEIAQNYEVPLGHIDNENQGWNVTRSAQFEMVKPDNLMKVPYARLGARVFHEYADELQLWISSSGLVYKPSFCGDTPQGYGVRTSTLMDKLQVQERKELFVPSFDLNLYFKVGDRVLVSNWSSDLHMKPRTIIDVDIQNDWVVFLVHEDTTGDIQSIRYMNTCNGFIKMGSVRQYADEYAGLKVGMKVRCRVAGIPNFPKKDVHEIVGFITDTVGPPLVLFSNYHTHWLPRVFEWFEIYEKGTVSYNKYLTEAPNLNRIRPQVGDMFVNYGTHIMVTYTNGRAERYGELDMMEHLSRGRPYNIGANFNDYMKISHYRLGYLNPRYPRSMMNEFELKNVWPDYHGGYTEMKMGRIYMKADWEVLNV